MKKLEDLNILVIGDIMLDKYVEGKVNRISPEAPVPIVKVTNEYMTLGGCGNVARNIKELGANVTCLSSVSSDENGDIIYDNLLSLNIKPMLVNECQKTIVKERIIASERKVQMLRIDREDIKPIPAFKLFKKFYDQFTSDALTMFDIIVISDYAKGVITNDLINYLTNSDCKYIVDPKPSNNISYGYPFMITPNEKECKQMGGASKLLKNGCYLVLETKGSKGITLYNSLSSWDIKSEPVQIYNVSGAGDTVIAVMSICLSIGLNALDSAIIANKCAGYVVTQPGTSIVPKVKFMDILKDHIGGQNDWFKEK